MFSTLQTLAAVYRQHPVASTPCSSNGAFMQHHTKEKTIQESRKSPTWTQKVIETKGALTNLPLSIIDLGLESHSISGGQVQKQSLDRVVELFPKLIASLAPSNEDGKYTLPKEQCAQHCMAHCYKVVCRASAQHTLGAADKREECRKCAKYPAPAVEPPNMNRVRAIQKEDLEAAAHLYENVKKEDEITIELQTANALIMKLDSLARLDICAHLRTSATVFTPKVLFNINEYFTATSSANSMIAKILTYCRTSLRPLSGQKRTVSIQDLEREMQACMRMEVFWWIARWCLPQVNNKSNYGMAVERYTRGKLHKGLKVLFEHMEDVVHQIVGLFVWWHHEHRIGMLTTEREALLGRESPSLENDVRESQEDEARRS